MKKNQRLEWSEECQNAFGELKEALMSPPVLVLPTADDHFILDTDASEESIGAVLSVVRDGHENVVAYAGRTLNKNELNYCVTRKELLAIVHFAKHFRQYLLGRQFVIRTDRAARRFGVVAADSGAGRTERKVVGAAWRVCGYSWCNIA